MFYCLNYGFNFVAGLLIVLGVVALSTNLGLISCSIWNWWPVLLIIAGIYVFVLKKKKKKIAASHIFGKILSDDRLQDKVKKIIDTVDEVIDKKLDEWHEEATSAKKSGRK